MTASAVTALSLNVVLSTPTGLTATRNLINGYVDLRWKDGYNTWSVYHRIEYSTDGGSTFSYLTDTNSANAVAVYVGSLTPNTFRFRVSAFNNTGISAPSTASNSVAVP